MTPAKKKMFNIESLGTTSKVIGTNSWLEDTLGRKRKRRDEGTPAKDTVSLVAFSGSVLTKEVEEFVNTWVRSKNRALDNGNSQAKQRRDNQRHDN